MAAPSGGIHHRGDMFAQFLMVLNFPHMGCEDNYPSIWRHQKTSAGGKVIRRVRFGRVRDG